MKKVIFLFLAVALASCSANKQQENYTVSQQQGKQNNQKDAIDVFNEFANSNPFYFDFDSSKIKDNALVGEYKNRMNKLGKNVRYTITGTCDDRGSDDYNDKLGLKRANAVKQALDGKNFNISAKSNGKRNFKKEYSNDEENWQANRKAVVVAKKVK